MPVNSNEADVERVLTGFARTTDEIFTLDELRRRMLSGQQIVMKYGVDLTAPDLHIGHAVNLWMYRAMQELGHKVEQAERVAPTRPHPSSPSEGAPLAALAPGVGLVDRLRDALSGRGR